MHHNIPEGESKPSPPKTAENKQCGVSLALGAVLFVSGAAVMIFELTGARILAPFAGTSIFVWTNIIGVILGSLSLGYWLGGKLADKNPSFLRFAYIVFVSGGFIFVAAIAHNQILALLVEAGGVGVRSLAAALILFAPASAFMGMLSPYAARLAIKNVYAAGETVGTLYAVSTIGSIAGTFLAGFVLIPVFTNTVLLLWTSVALFVAGTAVLPIGHSTAKVLVMIALLFLPQITSGLLPGKLPSGVIADTNSTYSRIIVLDSTHPSTLRPTRYLITDIAGVQSAMYLDNQEELAAEYTKFYRLGGYLNPQVERALMIGGGGYSYPKDFLRNFPRASLDVVELDPKITEFAEKYFNLQPSPKLSVFHEDGRVFLNNLKEKYDGIFVDAFQGCSPLWHLGTLEAVQKIYNSLNPGGVLVANIPGAFEGPVSKFFKAEYSTYKAVFPTVLIFAVSDPQNAELGQNIMFAAVKGEMPRSVPEYPEAAKLFRKVWIGEAGKGEILRDERAPVEFLQKELCSSENYFTKSISSAILR